ncbi:KOW domain-containing RNA-binding protein [Bacillus horti]
MAESEPILQIGQLVKIRRGRDAGNYAVVIRIENERFVWIADGDKRRFDRPKIKNVLHLQAFDSISSEVLSSIAQTNRVTNGKLRYAVNKFTELIEGQRKKGE